MVNDAHTVIRMLIKALRFQTALARHAGGDLYVNDGTHDENVSGEVPSNMEAFSAALQELEGETKW